MPTLILQGYATEDSALAQMDSETFTGLVIDYAESLGWDQGFAVDGVRQRIWQTWQVSEAGWLSVPGAEEDAVYLQVSLPDELNSCPPFAGICRTFEILLGKLGWAETTTYALALEPKAFAEPQGEGLYRKLAVGEKVPSSLALFGASGESRPQGLGASLGFAFAEMTDAPVVAPSSLVVPEFQDVVWAALCRLEGEMRGWSPELAGSVFNRAVWELHRQNWVSPVLMVLA